MTDRLIVLELARLEAAHLTGLVSQFADLLGTPVREDPALGRLAPAVYPDDAVAAAEFRALTEADLLERRRTDARNVLTALRAFEPLPDDPEDPALVEVIQIPLGPESARAWLRTLAAIRLVLASRLGIEGPDDHEPDDPRFGVYEWLGMRLDGLVTAIDDEE